MFHRVLVGIDEHDRGRDAIALAAELISADGVMTLAHIGTADPYVYRGASAAFEAAERRDALALLEESRQEAQVEAELRYGESTSVGRGLHELAESEKADLLVVGSCRRGLLGRVLLGSDTRAALNGAPCAVAVAPVGFALQPVVVREIGVGYDGTLESSHALELARQLATELEAQVSAFWAVSIPMTTFSAGVMPVSELIEELIDEARREIASLGVEPHAAWGQTAEELALYSASLDLLVVGSRGYGPFGRLMHGSVSRQLARLARCPLLVLPRGARASKPSEHDRRRQGAGAGIGE